MKTKKAKASRQKNTDSLVLLRAKQVRACRQNLMRKDSELSQADTNFRMAQKDHAEASQAFDESMIALRRAVVFDERDE